MSHKTLATKIVTCSSISQHQSNRKSTYGSAVHSSWIVEMERFSTLLRKQKKQQNRLNNQLHSIITNYWKKITLFIKLKLIAHSTSH